MPRFGGRMYDWMTRRQTFQLSPHSGATLFTFRLEQLSERSDKAVLLALRLFFSFFMVFVLVHCIFSIPDAIESASNFLVWFASTVILVSCLRGCLYFRGWGYGSLVALFTLPLLLFIAAVLYPGVAGAFIDLQYQVLYFPQYMLVWLAALGASYIRGITVHLPWYQLRDEDGRPDVFGSTARHERLNPSLASADTVNPFRLRPVLFAVIALLIWPLLFVSATRSELFSGFSSLPLPEDAMNIVRPGVSGSPAGQPLPLASSTVLFMPEGAALPAQYGAESPQFPILPVRSPGWVSEELFLCAADLAEHGSAMLTQTCRTRLRSAYSGGETWIREVYQKQLRDTSPSLITWLGETRFPAEFVVGMGFLMALFTVLYAMASLAAPAVQDRINLPMPQAGTLLVMELGCMAGAFATLCTLFVLPGKQYATQVCFLLLALLCANVALASGLGRLLPASYRLSA